VCEDRSVRTSENMAFSRAAIEQASGADVAESRVAFSTTNYHVFRGYVCAHQAGMAVEGMASPTKAYFWPNAFLREFVGLLVNQRRAIMITYVLLVTFAYLVEALIFSWAFV
ncbi:MAG: YdcF family protein, partial [Coriobacteriales bacterium]|nr:YdcF family protein [Coriobacteriales bacterium]